MHERWDLVDCNATLFSLQSALDGERLGTSGSQPADRIFQCLKLSICECAEPELERAACARAGQIKWSASLYMETEQSLVQHGRNARVLGGVLHHQGERGPDGESAWALQVSGGGPGRVH